MIKMFNYTINNLDYIKNANRSEWYDGNYNDTRHRNDTDMDHNKWNDTRGRNHSDDMWKNDTKLDNKTMWNET